ncbi:MAG TPA: flagellar basal body-associated FliL family protein [Solirubrobacteraceae bacterium]|jgi:flagellar basal body-associated protein FliL|nr:flagellar basal body-associated FliL family protein [Solirubrobacteraceae bacterium]
MSKKKLLIPLVLLLVLGVGYTMSKPKKTVKQKIPGTIYLMPQPFLLNLAEGHYAKLAVALELAPGQSDGASAAGASSSGEGAGTLPEEPAVREIVTDTITGENGGTLTSSQGRSAIKHRILAGIDHQTDVKVEAVLFPELTVQ